MKIVKTNAFQQGANSRSPMVFYHCTLSDRIPSIARQGLKPSQEPHWGGDLGKSSIGKTFFGLTPKEAAYYGMILFRNQLQHFWSSPIPIVLKVTNVNTQPDPEDKNTVFTDHIIPPSQIEVFWHGQWMPIQQARSIDAELSIRFDDDTGEYVDWEGSSLGDAKQAEDDVRGLLP